MSDHMPASSGSPSHDLAAVFRDLPTAAATQPAGPPAADWPAVAGYEILEPLAPGGMGVVYRARQLALNRIVALKMIRAGLHAGPQERARFRVEAEAVACLDHPNIIQIHDCGDWNGMPYLAMEFAEGGSLAQRLASRPLSPAQAGELVETLARAVHFVHERGLIHRDLKPANILLTQQGVPKLADFGLAKRLNQDQGLTQSHAVLGTASYMAPEQAAGDRLALGPAADVYALGAILYEVLTGRPPFLAETHELTIHQLLSEEPPPPTQLRPDVPAELEAICLKCLEKEPGRRFASALALAEDLRRYQHGEPISIRSLGIFDRHARLAQRAGYEILDVLGTGVLGTVYKALHLPLKRTVALKMIAVRGRLDPGRLARLRAEAEAVAQLHHPNIVEVYDFGEQNGEPYMATEYVEGRSLADDLAGPSRPGDQTAALLETLARAVHHAHLGGLVHTGLKPSRVRFAADGTAKITGFGLAKLLRDEPGRSDQQRAHPQARFPYLAPEQIAEENESLGPATDVYALGAMLYALLAGSPPAWPEAAANSLEPERRAELEPPRQRRPEVQRDLEAICLKCLKEQPAERYPSAAALAEDLWRFRSGQVLFIDDLDDPSQQERWARRAGYEILEVLGRDRDGFSYKARQVALDRIVVLKRLAARDRFVPAAKSRFRIEAHRLAKLRHPNIVQLYDQGEQNDLCYFAREFVDGPSLAEKAAAAPLPARSAAQLLASLARAIQAAHAANALHGGLNPGIVRLTPAGVPKITSLQRAGLPGADSGESAERQFRRLAGYLAPEQLERRSRALSCATDVYALGAILYTLLTGQAPFLSSTLAETLEQVQSQPPLPPRRLQPAIPSELEALCLHCLEKDATRRPASAEALADELGALLA